MFKDFGRRLQRDIKHIVDGRIANSEQASGNHMRVSSRPLSLFRAALTEFLVPLIVDWRRCQRHHPQTTKIRRMVRRKLDGIDGKQSPTLSTTRNSSLNLRVARVLQRCAYQAAVRRVWTVSRQAVQRLWIVHVGCCWRKVGREGENAGGDGLYCLT